MKRLFPARFKKFFGASLLAMGVSLGIMTAPAFAARDDGHAITSVENIDNFQEFYKAGLWQRLSRNMADPQVPSLEAVMRAEKTTGAVFCKMRREDGWYTNFIDCSKRGMINRIMDKQTGVMFASEGNPNYDFAYTILPSDRDKGLIKVVHAEHLAIVAGRKIKSAAPAVVAEAPKADVDKSPVALVRTPGPALSSQDDTATWTRVSADGDRKNSLKLQRRYADGQLVDVVLSGRGMKGKVFTVLSAKDGKLKWGHASPELTKTVLAPMAPKAEAPVYAAMPAGAPIVAMDATVQNFASINEFAAHYDAVFGRQSVAQDLSINALAGLDYRPSAAAPFETAAKSAPLMEDVPFAEVQLRPSFVAASPVADLRGSADVHALQQGSLAKVFAAGQAGTPDKYADEQLGEAQIKSLMQFRQNQARAANAKAATMRLAMN